ncbi:MAG: hypothetical protein KTR31_10205 [Myxococcales bacterium]|nr:hypothetical protein [Myxococcales bacterium]
MEPVQAELVYAVHDPDGPPPSTITVGPGGQGRQRTGKEERRTVRVHDARPLAGELSLDTHGFQLVEHPVQVDLWDDAAREGTYHPSVQALVQRLTGANRVVIFDETLRSEVPGRQQERHARGPVSLVHNDYTPWSAEQRVLAVCGDEAETLLRRRYAVVQVWQPIGQTIGRSPLAICDARTLSADSLIAARRVHPTRIGETYHVAYHEGQRWFWVPSLRADEALVFKTFDSAEDGRARFTAHTSFTGPEDTEAGPPRESLEIRTLAFF